MDDIRLPMVNGSMDDISQEGAGGRDSQESEMDSMSTQGQKAIYEKEANIQIDYENLDDDMKDVSCLVQFNIFRWLHAKKPYLQYICICRYYNLACSHRLFSSQRKRLGVRNIPLSRLHALLALLTQSEEIHSL